MTITVPDSLKSWIDQQASQAGFRSVDDYVAPILYRERERDQPGNAEALLRAALAEGGDPADVSPETVHRRKQEIEGKLLEGLDSGPAAPMTAASWSALGQRVATRLNNEDGP